MAEIDASFYLGALAVTVCGLAAVSAVWFRQGWMRPSRLRVVAVNAWNTVVLVVSIYCGVEAWYFLKADVDGIGFTLAT